MRAPVLSLQLAGGSVSKNKHWCVELPCVELPCVELPCVELPSLTCRA